MQFFKSMTAAWGGARQSVLALVLAAMSVLAASAASAGNLTNTAKAFGTAPGGSAGAVQSAISTVNIPITPKNPAYVVAKSVVSTTTSNGGSSTLTDGGDIITYAITVQNTGNVTLSSVSVSDAGVKFNGGAAQPLTAGPTYVSGDSNTNTKLDIGETWTYSASYTLTQGNVDTAAGITGGVSNTATVSALDPQGSSVTPDPSSTPTVTSTITSTPSLQIAKTANKAGPLVVGDVVTFSYLVTNNGNVTISGVGITETAFNGTGGTGALSPATGGSTTLAPGGTVTFTATYTVTQNDINILQP